MNEVDRLLFGEDAPEPTPRFSARVMDRIRAERHPSALPRGLILALVVAFVLLVGAPILFIAVQGAQPATTDGLSARLLWIVALLVATSLAAVVPLHLFED